MLLMQLLVGRASAGDLCLKVCSTGKSKSWWWLGLSYGLIQGSKILYRFQVRQSDLSSLEHGGHPRMES